MNSRPSEDVVAEEEGCTRVVRPDASALGTLMYAKTDENLTVITPCKSHSNKSRDEEADEGFDCEVNSHLEDEVTCDVSDQEPRQAPVCARSKVISMEDAMEEEENVCSICLDEFTDDDPAAETQCGHGYHLQCIMQWAQRSHDCPLCFTELCLVDEDLNSLLPFGEYVSPQQREADSSMIANMQLESFLIQLAAVERREHRRARMRMHRDSSGRQAEDRGHVVLQQGAYTPPREDSLIRNASLSLKTVKDKFASLFFSRPHSESSSPAE